MENVGDQHHVVLVYHQPISEEKQSVTMLYTNNAAYKQ